MKVLLLSPPGEKVYIRDYYCSKVSKANYLYEPPDFLILSGILHGRHDVKVIDAIASRLGEVECLRQIVDYKPDAVIFLTGSVSYKTDFPFLDKVKSATGALMIGCGDLFMEDYTQQLSENATLDAILLDFTDESILVYLDGGQKVRNIISKKDGKVTEGEVVRWKGQEFEVPTPRHELFPLSRYRYPFVRKRSFATVLTDYGCPFKCSFCIMSRIGYKVRSVNNVMDELRYLKSMGIDEIYFDDQTFGANRERTIRLLDSMVDEGLNMGWCAFSRVDVVDETLLTKMVTAGCHTLMFGVESGSQEILDINNKGITKEKILETFKLCKKHGIGIVATFLFGLPEEMKETAEETIRFALECGCDYASFNIAVPRMGTALRRKAIEGGLIQSDYREMDQSGSNAVLKTKGLTVKEVEGLKNKALRRFYMRPSYILREAAKIRSLHDVLSRLDGLYSILKNML
ncbi:MAG: radical SAM protein [Candidatus Altiarchaeota archaeon]